MDAGSRYKGLRFPLADRKIQKKKCPENFDRFIPNRSAMDFDFAHFMLSGRKVDKEHPTPCSPSKEAYRKQLKEIFNMNRTRILAFRNKPLPSADHSKQLVPPVSASQQTKRRRCIPQSAERTLDAPDVLDDFYLNCLDWSSSNILAIALGNLVYLWNPSDSSSKEIVAVDDEIGPVTSIKWSLDGRYLAVGLSNSHVQLWDTLSDRKLRTLTDGHRSRVASVDWNDHILTTGGMDGMIINNDVRVRLPIIGKYRGHDHEVCGLKWSGSGQQLASGGNDNVVHIWSLRMASSDSPNRWVHRFEDHTAAVKALSWCPFQSNLLATGGGASDHCIKFWNTHTGSCLNSVNTGSQVCSLLWSKHERELLSSHGFSDNQLILWKYPSMVKMAELYGHTSRVLHMTQSPDGYTVASAAADETLRLWNVFGTPEVVKPASKSKAQPFANLAQIR